jgi:hypothetical protein
VARVRPFCSHPLKEIIFAECGELKTIYSGRKVSSQPMLISNAVCVCVAGCRLLCYEIAGINKKGVLQPLYREMQIASKFNLKLHVASILLA